MTAFVVTLGIIVFILIILVVLAYKISINNIKNEERITDDMY